MTDVLRLIVLIATGAGIGLMGVITVVAYGVLRPPRRLGLFLWTHIATISLGVAGAMLLLAEAQLGYLGDPATWRLPATLVVILTLDLALVLVYRVEQSRLVEKRARRRVR